MTEQEVKNHPMYAIMAMTIGEKKAAEVIRTQVEAHRLANQAEVEASPVAKKITIPVSMNKLEAAEELERQWHDEETIIDVARQFGEWNWKDVLVATKKAAEEHFGWIQGKAKHSMFGTQLPTEIEVVVDIKDGIKITERCFYGAMSISAWENAEVNVGGSYLSCKVKKRYSAQVKDFYDLIQKNLDTNSIYRGKTITVTEMVDPWGKKSLDFDIFELKVSDKIILNDDIERVVENFIIDDLGEDGKRCYLFSGGYGNAKTETAMRVAGEGLKKNMAFFYCKDANVFHVLLKQAVNYQPCIVFLEDLDEIGAGDERNADMNRILNTLDGVQTKGNDLTVIFTTNHENRINPALRRPGRIDLVINFGNPNKKSVAKIFETYLTPLTLKFKPEVPLDYTELANLTPNVPGAVVAEIAKRAYKLCTKKEACTSELVQAAIDSMAHHVKLMNEPIEAKGTGRMTIILDGANMKVKGMNDDEEYALDESMASLSE